VRTFEGHASWVRSIAFSADGNQVLSGSDDNTLKLWDLASGQLLRTFQGHTGRVWSVAFSPDGARVLSGSRDATIRIWKVATGELLATLMGSATENWLTLTRDGFFAGSVNGDGILSIVRRLEITTISQVHQSLFSPDLVREALAGDPDGELKRATEITNLDKVIDSGPAPLIEIIPRSPHRTSDTDLITVAAHIKDRGKGVGRIEWRVNGIVTGVTNVAAGAGPDYEIQKALALDHGDNAIEVVAYNARNLLASLPAHTTISFTGTADAVKPRLHILAIGINAYHDTGWTPPGAKAPEYFPPLALAVRDAESFAAELSEAGKGFYGEVRVWPAFDADATPSGLDKIIQKISAEIGPRDTFVLFAAAHGYSHDGRFYLIPQDYQGGTNPAALSRGAIGQERLQDWIANRIKAKKAVLLLDMCESGALTNGYAHSRTDAPASEAALGRLHEATGRPILTAAAAGKPAFEGYRGHGVFTWALIDALYHGDTNGDGLIELSELVAHVQNTVPRISDELQGIGRAAVVIGGLADRQSAHFGSTGGDFALVRRLQ
jgi:hypothetical protein